MKALTVVGPGVVTFGEGPGTEIAPGDVRVGVGAVGLCGTDFGLVGGTLGLNSYPVIPGHEVSGTVLDTRSRFLEVGQKVILDPLLSCGKCWACVQGTPQCCDDVGVLGVASNGGARDEVVLPAAQWIAVPDQLSLVDAALVEPVHVATTIFRSIASQNPDSVLVVGAGAIGMLVMALLQHWRPHTAVFASDLMPDRVRRAATWGAMDLASLGDGLVDCTVDGAGTEASISIAVRHTRRGGTIVVYGVPLAAAGLPDADQMFRRNLRLRFVRLYNRDFSAAIGILTDGVISAAQVVGTRLTLASAAPFLNDRGWRQQSHWGKALIVVGEGSNRAV